jgi:hypothetical protein
MMIIAVFSLIWFIDGFDKISNVVLFDKLHISQTNMKYMLKIMFYIFQLFKCNNGILNKFPLH